MIAVIIDGMETTFDSPMEAAKHLLAHCTLSELRRLILHDMRAIQRDAAERGIMLHDTPLSPLASQ